MSFWASIPVLASVFGMALVLAIVAPLHWLLFVDLFASVFPTRVNVGGVLVNANDIVIACLVLGLGLRARIGKLAIRIPYLGLWLLIGALMSVSYVSAPFNEQFLTGPLQIAYQLYRYVWVAWLVYPLSALLLDRPERVRAFMVVVALIGAVLAIQAIPGGYSGARGGPLLKSNALAMGLHFPFMVSFATLLTAKSPRVRVACVASLILLARAISFSGSRGGMLGDVVGILVLLAIMGRLPTTRRRLVSLAVAAVLLAAGLVVVKPDVLERPTVQRFLSVSEAGDESSTLTWRLEKRWPRFWDLAMERPFLGHVSDLDPSLRGRARTPHNGYLSVAVRWGFPVLILTLVFFTVALRRCVRLIRTAASTPPAYGLFATATLGSLSALLVHCLVDNGFGLAFPMRLMWMSIGIAIAITQPQAAGEESTAESTEASLPSSLPDPGLDEARGRA